MKENDVLDRQVGYIGEQVKLGAAPVVQAGEAMLKRATRKENPETGESAGFLRTLYDSARMRATRAIYRRRMMRVNRPRR